MKLGWMVAIALVSGLVGGAVAMMQTALDPGLSRFQPSIYVAQRWPWFSRPSSQPAPDLGPSQGLSSGVDPTLTTTVAGEQTLRLSEAELTQMLRTAIAQHPQGDTWMKAIQTISVTIDDGQLTSGLMVTLSQLPPDSLPPEGQQILGYLTQVLPSFLQHKPIYIGVSSQPAIANGQVIWSDHTTLVTVSRMQVPLETLTPLLGISMADLQPQISARLTELNFIPTQLSLDNGVMVISGRTP